MCLLGYSLETKGYKYYNPITRNVRVRKDVVLNELSSWYADIKENIKADVKESLIG